MNRYRLIITATVLVGMLSGCGGVYIVDSLFDDSASKDACNGMKVPNERVINPQCKDYKDAFLAAQTDVGKRNYLLIELFRMADDVCRQHKGDIRATATNLNLTFGTMTTLFAATASLSAGTAAKTYAAAATASNASRSLVNEEVYRREMADVVLKAIEVQRTPKRRGIEDGLKTATISEYPVERGIQDIVAYHDVCSFANGMTFVTQSVESRKETKMSLQQKLAKLRDEHANYEKAIAAILDTPTQATLRSQNNALMTEIVRLSAQVGSASE